MCGYNEDWSSASNTLVCLGFGRHFRGLITGLTKSGTVFVPDEGRLDWNVVIW